MTRSLVVLTLVATCGVACSETSQQPAGSERTTSPASSAAAPAPQQPAPSETSAPPPATSRAAERAPAAVVPRPSAPASEPAAAPRPTAPSQPPAAAVAPAPPAPQFKEVTIPAGTSLSVKLLSSLASNTSHAEDPVRGSLARAVVVDGLTALPEGAPISGTVVAANESGRVKGRASVAFRFDRMSVRSESQKIQTATVTREAAADKKSDVKKGGIGAGVGAVVGGVVGGGKGAAIGAVAGGTGAVLATKGDEVEVPAGTTVSVLLQEPLTVTVPLK